MKKILFLSTLIVNLSFGQSTIISPNYTLMNNRNNYIVVNSGSLFQYPNIAGLRSSGTESSPTNIGNNMELFRIEAQGYNNGAYKASGEISFFATQTWIDRSQGSKIRFSTTTNNFNYPSEKMVIDHDGKVGIGLTSPYQILDINGRMRIRHTPGFTSGVWMSNSTNGLGDGDGAFIGLNTDTQAGIYIGNAWRFGFNSNGNAVITGFTQLGNTTPAGAAVTASAPAIKTMLLTGNTALTEGSEVSVATGLPNSKILSYNVLIQYATYLLQPEYSELSGVKYHTFIDNGVIFIRNSATQSELILNKSFKVLVTYTE